MKSSNVQRMPAIFADHTNLGALVGLSVDDLLVALSSQGISYTEISITIEQKGLAQGDTTWTITTTAETKE